MRVSTATPKNMGGAGNAKEQCGSGGPGSIGMPPSEGPGALAGI